MYKLSKIQEKNSRDLHNVWYTNEEDKEVLTSYRTIRMARKNILKSYGMKNFLEK